MYTGNVRYEISSYIGSSTLYHQNVAEFDYQSYKSIFDDGIAPYTNFKVIENYLGEDKMILSSDKIGVPFKISKKAHYNRNQYNIIDNGSVKIAVDELYKTESSAQSADGFTKQTDMGTYFHRLLSTNKNNNKYLKKVSYYNLNASVTSHGSIEIVYDGNGNVEYDDLVTFSFNFGDKDTYPDTVVAAYDSHWVLDVYPYLVWGNTQVDSDNHSAFERFVWDKDSAAKAFGFANYEGRNYQKNELLALYKNVALCGPDIICEGIGNANATPIPNSVRDGSILFNDTSNPTFSAPISLKYKVESKNRNFDWTSTIFNVYDNSVTGLRLIEVADPVDFSKVGKYYVKVAVEDSSGNRTTRTITVTIYDGISSC